MRDQKGITLIALVITIIVLLILAGVSIAMLTGDNGILTRANDAKEDTAVAEAVERINMELNAAYALVLSGDIGETFTDDDVNEIKGNLPTGEYEVSKGANSKTLTITPKSTEISGKINNGSVTITTAGDATFIPAEAKS